MGEIKIVAVIAAALIVIAVGIVIQVLDARIGNDDQEK